MLKLKTALKKAAESKNAVELYKDGMTYILVMNKGDNRLSQVFVDGLHSALDKIDKDLELEGKVMVTLSTHPKNLFKWNGYS